MTPAAIATARRLVAARWWSWGPGMLAIPAPGSNYEGWCRILTTGDDGAVFSWTDEDGDIVTMGDGSFDDFADLMPCLTDNGTAGHLLADLHQLAIARRLEIRISWEPDEGEWRVGACHEDDHTGGAAGYAPDLGHAVALALLAVHEQENR